MVEPVHTRWLMPDKDAVLAACLSRNDSRMGLSERADAITRFISRDDQHLGKVAIRDHKVIGFMLYVLRHRAIQLISLVVDQDYRRQRVGTQLLTDLTSLLSLRERRWIYTKIRESNLGAQLFLRENAFRAVPPVLRGWCIDTGEDAYRLVLDGGQLKPTDVGQTLGMRASRPQGVS